jgi:hypothetical protein
MPGEDQLGAALATKRDRILQLPPAVQEKFAELIWRRSVGPKQAPNFTSKEDAEAAKKSFVNSFLKRPRTQLPSDFGKEPVKHGVAEKVGATVSAAGAGVAGGVSNVLKSMGSDKSTHILPFNLPKKVTEILNKYVEAPAYAYASEIAPDASRYAAGAGKGIVSTIAAEGVSGSIPLPGNVGPLVKTVGRAAKGAATGGAGMAPFSPDPEEIGKGAGYGAILEPIVGPLLSRKTAKSKVSGAPKVAAATKSSGISDISETVSQRKFGKSVSDLSPSEISEHAKAVREELIARANAAKELAKTEKKVAKAGAVKPAKASKSGVATPKIAKKTSEQARAEAIAQVKARAEGTPTGSGANASTTASQTVGTPASPPPSAELEQQNQAEAQRLAQAKINNIAAAANAQNPQVAAATSAVKDFAGVPEITKVPEGEHGKGPLGTRAKGAERKARERAAAAGAQPSTGNVVGTEGDIGKKPGARLSVSETPTVELESDFKSLSPEAYKILQSLKTKQKWDDSVYRGNLIEWFTKLLQDKGKPKQ